MPMVLPFRISGWGGVRDSKVSHHVANLTMWMVGVGGLLKLLIMSQTWRTSEHPHGSYLDSPRYQRSFTCRAYNRPVKNVHHITFCPWHTLCCTDLYSANHNGFTQKREKQRQKQREKQRHKRRDKQRHKRTPHHQNGYIIFLRVPPNVLSDHLFWRFTFHTYWCLIWYSSWHSIWHVMWQIFFWHCCYLAYYFRIFFFLAFYLKSYLRKYNLQICWYFAWHRDRVRRDPGRPSLLEEDGERGKEASKHKILHALSWQTDILSDKTFHLTRYSIWHFIWHTFWIILIFYLAFFHYLAFYCISHFAWHFLWHSTCLSIGHFMRHSVWHSIWHIIWQFVLIFYLAYFVAIYLTSFLTTHLTCFPITYLNSICDTIWRMF